MKRWLTFACIIVCTFRPVTAIRAPGKWSNVCYARQACIPRDGLRVGELFETFRIFDVLVAALVAWEG